MTSFIETLTSLTSFKEPINNYLVGPSCQMITWVCLTCVGHLQKGEIDKIEMVRCSTCHQQKEEHIKSMLYVMTDKLVQPFKALYNDDPG